VIQTPGQATGTKSYYVIKTQGGVNRHVRIGGFKEINIPQARQMASDLLLQVVKGEVVGTVRCRQEKADPFSPNPPTRSTADTGNTIGSQTRSNSTIYSGHGTWQPVSPVQ
jgi:hypothetical protein